MVGVVFVHGDIIGRGLWLCLRVYSRVGGGITIPDTPTLSSKVDYISERKLGP